MAITTHTESYRDHALLCEVDTLRDGSLRWRCLIDDHPTLVGAHASTTTKLSAAAAMAELVAAAHQHIDRTF
jgi:hypothetical protein